MRADRLIPPAGPARVLAAAQLTNSLGDGAYYVCSALYFTRIVGLSPTQIGFGLTLGWAVGAVAGVPLGHLADRRGPRAVAILLAVATAAAVGSFLVVRSFPAFVVAALCYACAQCGLSAARQALLAGLVPPERRTETRAYLQSTVNAGLAVGAAVGGVALQYDSRAGYLAVFAMDALSFLASALVLRRLPAVEPVAAVAGEPRLAVLRDRPYALVALLNTVMLLYMPLLSLVIPLWIVERTAAPGWLTAALLVLNTVSVVLLQVRVAQRVDGLATAARFVRYAGVLLLVSCAGFALSATGASAWSAAGVLLLAAGLQVAGEMLLASGAWEIGFGLAPADKQGQYQGFFGTGVAVARMLGPLLLTSLIIAWGTPGWLVLGALFALAGGAMTPAVRWAERSRAARASAATEPGASAREADEVRTP
ncbi:MFS transporter [Kitasatospora atroaurantiaca]|uniref:MFS transporter n=1 Tax=Kitasatospora atroaurantiaca TaxID=285545 RepID=A0A561EL38_9ACTN|nr:MFS transporter [Kitasatospora atroaurantiaca]TWE16321.1 MFS transporter [Kitasatospora atroaurantiaca]